MMMARTHGFLRIVSLMMLLATRSSSFTLAPPPKSNLVSSPAVIRRIYSTRLYPNSFSSKTRLSSLAELVEDVKTSAALKPQHPRTLFVGGKGGVGKTSISAALAVNLASKMEDDLNVLIVSTDPAHSLGDALDVELRSSHGRPVVMTDTLTGGRLHACEVDTEKALQEFQSSVEAFDVERMATALGVSPSLLESFGLGEFSGLLQNPPPGLDELVALSNVLDNPELTQKFDVILVDTAPTGHTLRLLQLPQFLDGLLGKLVKLRLKLSGLASTLQSLFGDTEASQRAQTIDTAVNKLEEFQRKMKTLTTRLQDHDQTSFLVVTIPTKLSVAESQRLMMELDSQGVSVTDIVVNQCVGETGDETSEALKSYYDRRKAGQQRWLGELQKSIDEVSSTKEYKANGNTGPIALTQVPFFDVELIGVPALAYLGRCLSDTPHFSYLMDEPDDDDDTRVVICGGKGGVGKTTTSASLAVTMASKGHNVALISTDPAHSLGDAIDMDLSGGALIDCPLVGVPPTEGSLEVMEIDPSAALGQFKSVVDQLVGTKSDGESGGQNLGNTLKEIGEIFDTLPAGTDEVVALAKVVNLVKKGDFDRIILDTAPTGHTLRMLTTPGFLADLIEKVLAISAKLNSNSALKMFIRSASKGEDFESVQERARSTLLSFQLQMWDLEDLFANPLQTEFLIVTVPTELATRESIRLLNDLTFEAPDMPIKVRNVVANQVLDEDGADVENFLKRVHDSQARSIREIEGTLSAIPNPPTVTRVEYLDTEPRGVFGLKVLADELLKEPSQVTT